MDDVAKKDEGKRDIQATQGDWAATARINQLTAELDRAKRALERAGFMDKGGAEWCPPLGKSASPLLDRISELTQQKDGAYRERNQVLALLARMAVALGWKAGIGLHPVEDEKWEKDWRTVLFIDAPTGQCSWHFHDSEVHLLSGLPFYEGAWDGHTTEEKYDRVARALRVDVAVVTSRLPQVGEWKPLDWRQYQLAQSRPTPKTVEYARSIAQDIADNQRVSEEAMRARREEAVQQPWAGAWPRPFGYNRREWDKLDDQGRALVWYTQMTAGFMGMATSSGPQVTHSLTDVDLELRQFVSKRMQAVLLPTHFGTYISTTDCGRQIADYKQLGGLRVERMNHALTTCPECKQR